MVIFRFILAETKLNKFLKYYICPMDSTRQQKVSRLLQKELANAFQRELQTIIDKSLVTFTAVRISPDLSVAKIYFSIFPPAKRESVFESIKNQNKEIRHLIAQKLKSDLRIIPELIFYIDDSLDYAEKIENLLKK